MFLTYYFDEIENQSKEKEVKKEIKKEQPFEPMKKEKTKKEIIEELNARGIEHNPRDRKDVLLASLGGE